MRYGYPQFRWGTPGYIMMKRAEEKAAAKARAEAKAADTIALREYHHEQYQQKLRDLRRDFDAIVHEYHEMLRKAGFDPNQLRVLAGNPDGGQWTDDPRWVSSRVTEEETADEPQEIALPDEIEGLFDDVVDFVSDNPLEIAVTAVSLIPAVRVAKLVQTAYRFWQGGGSIVTSRRFLRAIKSIEKYFGGKPDRTFFNKNGDLIMIRGDKKIRFDVNNPHGDKPHFQIERYKNGKWLDEGSKHRYYFKER